MVQGIKRSKGVPRLAKTARQDKKILKKMEASDPFSSKRMNKAFSSEKVKLNKVERKHDKKEMKKVVASHRHSKEDLHKAHKHMKEHGG